MKRNKLLRRRAMKIEHAKVAIIDNSIDSSVYNPLDHWKAYLKVPWESFKARKSHFPDLRNGFTHLILTGSEASILERETWVYEEVEIVQEAVEKELSILGSCYGHQLLALALGGPSYVQRSAQPEVGWISIKIEEKNELLGRMRTAYSFSVHFDEVVNLGKPFHILASSKHCPIQAFALRGKPIWGLQIHPEIDIPSARKLLENLVSLNLKTRLFFEKGLKSRPKDSGLIRQIVKNFLRIKEKE